jgi:hypothetical protein
LVVLRHGFVFVVILRCTWLSGRRGNIKAVSTEFKTRMCTFPVKRKIGGGHESVNKLAELLHPEEVGVLEAKARRGSALTKDLVLPL